MDNNLLIITAAFVAIIALPRILGAIRRISSAKAKELIDKGAVVLDVRSASEYRSGHIKKAVNIPHTSLNSKASKSVPKKDTDVIVYCQTGGRSSQAFRTLKRLGYTNVYDLGGITRWTYGTVK